MLLMIDNYDSFTYNLVQYFGELGETPVVYRNDKLTLSQIESMQKDADKNGETFKIIISPGPGNPETAGISVDVIKHFAGKVPLLGVCLGHQSIGYAYGAKIVHAKKLMHGKTSQIKHDGKGVFKGLPNPFTATRYHSLVIDEKTLPSFLEVSARSEDGEIMGIRHKQFSLEGVQFHPESILTHHGKKLLQNFLDL
jgi:anthranilate synthase/aminodeoxychorismate synthase-like glutamine amidotransferase